MGVDPPLGLSGAQPCLLSGNTLEAPVDVLAATNALVDAPIALLIAEVATLKTLLAELVLILKRVQLRHHAAGSLTNLPIFAYLPYLRGYIFPPN